jgi:hypothetical protein
VSAACFFPDNTVLINFEYINRLSLLGDLIPDRRWCEVIAQECAESARIPGLVGLGRAPGIFGAPLTPTERERERTFALRDMMRQVGDAATKHVGEAETIAIVTSRGIKAIFATDDRGAGAAARAEGITVISSWDLLRLAHRKNHFTFSDAYGDAQTLDSLGRGWPPCARTPQAFNAWIT